MAEGGLVCGDDRGAVDNLRALLAKYYKLQDGKHDKQLIAKYLEEYRGRVIPPHVFLNTLV